GRQRETRQFLRRKIPAGRAQGLRRMDGGKAFRKSKCRSSSFCAQPLRDAGEPRSRRREHEGGKQSSRGAERRQCFRSVPCKYCGVRRGAFLRQCIGKVRSAAGACSRIHFRRSGVRVCGPADGRASALNGPAEENVSSIPFSTSSNTTCLEQKPFCCNYTP